jgi:hypothetical protein
MNSYFNTMVAEISMRGRLLSVLGLCAPIMGYGLYLLRQMNLMRKWQQAEGEVVSLKQKWEVDQHGIAPKAIIAYSYQINGRIFQGNRITVSDWLLAKGALQVSRLNKRYSIGGPVTVYFDPERPERGILERPGYTLPLVTLGVGLGAFITLALLILGGTRMPPGWHPQF